MAKNRKQDPLNEMESKVAKNNFFKAVASFIGGFFPKSKSSSFSSQRIPVDFVKIPNTYADNPIKAGLDPKNLLRVTNNKTLEKLFDSWIQDITEISFHDRLSLYSEIDFMAQADPFVSRVINLVADEATQIDMQDHLISVETPDVRMTRRIYELLNRWGVTQSRVRSTIFNIYKYGEAFWGLKVSERGVEKVLPLSVKQVIERLEFNPIQVVEKLNGVNGYYNLLSKSQVLQRVIDIISGETEEYDDITNIFETHLFGFVLSDDIVVAPWEILHFRYNFEGTELSPYGRSDLIDVLTPFKLSQSTQALQALARIQSFPVTVYSVNTPQTMDEVSKFEAIERIRQEYDNVGVTPSTSQSEVYSVNTKIWIPKDLLDISVHESKVETDFVGDLEMYQDRVVVATGVPKGYLVQEWGGFGNSAISLVEQFKPFARKVFSIQSVFLESLEHLIRLHFAITGEFDYRTTFTLGMRFPVEEFPSDKIDLKKSSFELAQSVIDTVRLAIGAEEDEPLPTAIIQDILTKYTFLTPEDIARWTTKTNIFWKSYTGSNGSSGTSDSKGDEDFGSEGDEGFDTGDDEGSSSEDFDFGEALKVSAKARLKKRLMERFKLLTERYNKLKEEVYFNFLEKNCISDFVRNRKHIRACYRYRDNEYLYSSFRTKSKVFNQKSKLRDSLLSQGDLSLKMESGEALREVILETKKEFQN